MKNKKLLESMKQEDAIKARAKNCKEGYSLDDGFFAGADELSNPAFDSFETYIERANLF